MGERSHEARAPAPARPTRFEIADPAGRFSLAFGQTSLDDTPTWTALDQEYPNLVTSYSIERGRQYELDRTDTGRATVSIADVDGILDPTRVDGPYFGQIEPLMQAACARWDPIAGEWSTRYRGFVEDLDYSFDPSQGVNRLTLTLVDLFAIIASIEMYPGYFGDPPPPGSEGQVFFEDTDADNGMQIRVWQVLGDAGIPAAFYVVFSGNVDVHETVYSPGESAMTAIAEAIDAEFPGVANAYCDRFGRLAVHGRFARFDPAGTASTVTPDRWDFHVWQAGDGARVAVEPTTTAHIRRFAFNRGLSKVINRALATPVGIADADVAGQTDQVTDSVGIYGIRGWSAQNLITKAGRVPGFESTDLVETHRYAHYYVNNFAYPANRISECVFRSIHPEHEGAAATWEFLSKCDISDEVDVWIGSPGGGGFSGDAYFIEGIREEVRPLNPDYDDVTLSLDLSPFVYFEDNPWEAG